MLFTNPMRQLVFSGVIFLFIALIGCRVSLSPSVEATPSNIASGNLPLVTLTATTPASLTDCQKPFQNVIMLTEAFLKDIGDEKKVTKKEEAIITQVIEAGEYFLDNCTNPKMPLSDQKERIAELQQLAQVIPPSFDCAYRYQPTTQLFDLDGDSTNELILHTQVIRCDINALFGLFGGGGISLVFRQDRQAGTWQGILVTPCIREKCPLADHTWLISPQPVIAPFGPRDAQGRTPMLVIASSLGQGNLQMGHILTIWHWEGNKAKIVEQLTNLGSSWCEVTPPSKWEFSEEGYIYIPATEATKDCPKNKAIRFTVKNDKWIVVENP